MQIPGFRVKRIPISPNGATLCVSPIDSALEFDVVLAQQREQFFLESLTAMVLFLV